MKEKTELKKRRIQAGMLQAELAKKSGVYPSTLSRFEGGWLVPGAATAHRIANALDCSVKDLWPSAYLPAPDSPVRKYAKEYLIKKDSRCSRIRSLLTKRANAWLLANNHKVDDSVTVDVIVNDMIYDMADDIEDGAV